MSLSLVVRETILMTPTAARAYGPTGLAPGWTVEAAASGGNRSAIPTAARKTLPRFPQPRTAPATTRQSTTLDQQKGGLPTAAKADTFN